MSSYQSHLDYVPTIFEEIVSSQEESIDSMGSVKNVVNGIIDQLSTQVKTTMPDVHSSDEDDEIEVDDVSSQSSDNSSSDVNKGTQRKSDVVRERKKIEQLFGVVHQEPAPEAKAEQLYLDQCCSWFKRTTRRENKNKRLIDDFAIEELSKEKKNFKRKKISNEGGGDE